MNQNKFNWHNFAKILSHFNDMLLHTEKKLQANYNGYVKSRPLKTNATEECLAYHTESIERTNTFGSRSVS